MTSNRPGVAVAGASGFVGRALLRALQSECQTVALSRALPDETLGAEWRACDLFSLLETERALAGCAVAIYLVHSMLPARLTQASFADMDLILADNFARACAVAGVGHIIYLGGLVPTQGEGALSPHLASRLEVERALASRGAMVTALRAGLIVGAGGSSFRIMLRLVERLPLMLCPYWTQTRTQPIALSDVVALIRFVVRRDEPTSGAFDIGGPDVMTYLEMMERTARLLRRPRLMIPVPVLTPRLSALWVRAVTGAPGELINPLLESLRHEMVVSDRRLQDAARVPGLPFEEAMGAAIAEERARSEAPRKPSPREGSQRRGARRATVCSIQRLTLPPGRDALWVAREYARWLPGWFRFGLRVQTDALTDQLIFWLGPVAVLILQLSRERSTTDRPLYYIVGGWLTHPPRPRVEGGPPGRLEFRESPDGASVLAAVLNFHPRLPWWIYRMSQAPLHLWVMRAFGRHLKRSRLNT